MKKKSKKRCGYKRITSEHLALRKIRQELGLTLKQAGELVGLSSKGLGAIENGRVSLDKDRIQELLNSYQLSENEYEVIKYQIEKESIDKPKRVYIKNVLSNSDRRSYQKKITKECRVLRSLRRTKGISQVRAGELCGYPRASIGHIENGRIELSNARIRHMVNSYGYSYRFFEECVLKEQQRDEVVDFCIDKMKRLDDDKVEVIKNLLLAM